MMKFIHDTVSVCNHCYRHIPGVVFERDDKIWLSKKCQTHGVMEEVVEPDVEFYYSLSRPRARNIDMIMFEATDKCQLKCPHCYHLPNNKSVDASVETLLSKFSSYPKGFTPIIVGAEATLHKDIVPLAHSIVDQYGKTRIISNGIKFSDANFTKELLHGYNILPSIGLNHYSYQGKKVHEKQLRGIANCKEFGELEDVGYTLESLDHLPDIIEELDKLKDEKLTKVRIRAGSFIGRSSDLSRNYLSTTVKRLKSLLGNDLEMDPWDDNPYHVMAKWNGLVLRIIQWPDVRNIDLEELETGPWADFSRGAISNFVHQVIMRDAFVNNKLKPLDQVPEYYRPKTGEHIHHWKDNWTGPTEVKELEYKITDPEKMPVPIGKVIPIKELEVFPGAVH
jgi:hypothetical protein